MISSRLPGIPPQPCPPFLLENETQPWTGDDFSSESILFLKVNEFVRVVPCMEVLVEAGGDPGPQTARVLLGVGVIRGREEQ